MVNLVVRQNRTGPIRGHHPWVFSGALKNIPEGLESGMPVHLWDEQGHFLAQGYFNSYSQIAVRLWSWEEGEEIDVNFFVKRVRAACEIRDNFVADKNTNSYRLINSESDLLPGLIVDKYADYLSVQFHTKGMEFWKSQIIDALEKVMQPRGIYERSDVGHRIKEQNVILDAEKNPLQTPRNSSAAMFSQNDSKPGVGLLAGKIPERIKILENGLKFWVDIQGGQKTGFFLDQRDKRMALKKYVANKNVLNCFSYTGGFSVYALAGGASRVTSVDTSESALKIAEENVKLNNFKNHETICADVKAYLSMLTSPVIPVQAGTQTLKQPLDPGSQSGMTIDNGDNAKFDVIILDPPAFIKDRHKIKEGIQGYKKINELALKMLPPDGILVTASCSAHLSLSDFRFMLSEAAGRAGRIVQILETFTHGLDHPELVAFSEGEYLKCIFALVK